VEASLVALVPTNLKNIKLSSKPGTAYRLVGAAAMRKRRGARPVSLPEDARLAHYEYRAAVRFPLKHGRIRLGLHQWRMARRFRKFLVARGNGLARRTHVRSRVSRPVAVALGCAQPGAKRTNDPL
jgi:hypothetical protein